MADVVTIDHGTLVRWVNESDDATIDSRENAEKCRDYYDSKQLSSSELTALKKRKQAPVVINRIKPKIDGLAGMERTNRTTARAYPRTPKHEQDATGATEAIRFVLQDNFYNQLRSAAWDNLCVEGTGGLDIIVKARGKSFDIIINHIMWDRIVYDPHSRRKDFSDARYLGQVVWMDYDQALAMYPKGKDVLDSLQTGSATYDDKPRWMDTIRNRVKIVELYYLKDGDWYYATFTRGGYVDGEPKISPYKNEDGETEPCYEFASLFVDREGNRYGACLQYLDVQDEINKRRSKALHLMSVRQVMLERGAVEDVNKARQELARPDGVVEITPGMVFEVLKTGDMAAAQFNLLQESKNEIDAVGYNAANSGKEQKSMSGVALENRRMAGQTEIAPMFDVLRHLDVRVYRKIWNRIKQYWKEEKWVRVTDDQANVRFVGLNRRVPKGQLALEQAKAQGLPPEQLQMLAQQIASDPTAQEMTTQNDVAQLDVDIIIDDAPDSVTMQEEEFVALSEMVKSGIPIPPTAIIEASNLKNKHKILQEMQQSQIDPEQVKKMQEEMQKLAQENQVLKADQQTEQQKIATKAQADQASLQAKHQQALAELQMKKEIQAAELQLEREKAEAEIAIMQAKAQAEIAIKRAQLEADVGLKTMELGADAEHKSKELEFEKQCFAEETEMKKKEEAKKTESDAMPKVMETMKDMHKSLTDTINKLHAPKKKQIKLIKEGGQTTGAEVSES